VGVFKAFPIQEDDHLRTTLRYVERNPLRAGLVGRAEDWPWSSLHGLARGMPSSTLHPGPEAPRRGEGWVERVNAPMTEAEVDALRRSVTRGAPFGSGAWTIATATHLGLASSLRGLAPERSGGACPPSGSEPSSRVDHVEVDA
jgi:putative transposase